MESSEFVSATYAFVLGCGGFVCTVHTSMIEILNWHRFFPLLPQQLDSILWVFFREIFLLQFFLSLMIRHTHKKERSYALNSACEHTIFQSFKQIMADAQRVLSWTMGCQAQNTQNKNVYNAKVPKILQTVIWRQPKTQRSVYCIFLSRRLAVRHSLNLFILPHVLHILPKFIAAWS